MNLPIAILAGVTGYLIGSISFARLVVRIRAPEGDVSTIKHHMGGGTETFESGSIGATAVRHQLGTRYGCLVGILDILKGLLPTLVFKLWQPDAAYYLITAILAVVGHNHPLHYGFRGGRGLSTLYGGFLVLDWIGVLVTNIGGMLLGGLLGQVMIMRYAGLLLMIPWIWIRTHDTTKLAYVLVANALFWYAISPELRQVLRLRTAEERPDEQQLAEMMGMGSVYRMLGRFSLANLLGWQEEDERDEA